MNPNRDELSELERRIARLPLADQLFLFEKVLADARRTISGDHEANRRAMEALVADPYFRAAFRGDDVPYGAALRRRVETCLEELREVDDIRRREAA